MPDLLIGIASWIALAGFCWLLLLNFRDRYERRARLQCAKTSLADSPDAAQVRISLPLESDAPQEFPRQAHGNPVQPAAPCELFLT